MALSREMRESLLTVLAPVPYLVFLLPALPLSADVGPVAVLFVISLLGPFVYLFLVRSLKSVRSDLAQGKNSFPSDEEYQGSTYWEQFKNISSEALFGDETEIEPITEHTNQPLFPHLVYSFWGTVTAIVIFVFSGGLLAWLVQSGNLNSMSDIPVSENLIQNAPLGPIDFLFTLFPIFEGLSFPERVVVGGVTFLTGFFFLTAARNLIEVADDVHRRVLRYLVKNNPLVQNELINVLTLASPYLLFFLMYRT